MCAAPMHSCSRVAFLECSPLAPSNAFFGIQHAVELNDFRHAPGPPGLMARAQARSVVSIGHGRQKTSLERVHERWCPQ